MRRRGERGETLAEVLVSTTLLGIIGFGIIGAIASVLISTDIDRRVSAGETVLRSYVAAIEAAPLRGLRGSRELSTGMRSATRDAERTSPAEVTGVLVPADAGRGRPAGRPGPACTLTLRRRVPDPDPGVQRIDVRGAEHRRSTPRPSA